MKVIYLVHTYKDEKLKSQIVLFSNYCKINFAAF